MYVLPSVHDTRGELQAFLTLFKELERENNKLNVQLRTLRMEHSVEVSLNFYIFVQSIFHLYFMTLDKIHTWVGG